MSFHSIVFIIFAAIFFGLWPLCRQHNNLRWGLIVVASFFFYGAWDWRFLFLIIFSGLVDFFAALGIARQPSYKRFYLVFSLLANLGLLAIFKYSVFFADNLTALAGWVGWQIDLKSRIPEFAMILPIGISFYTFQSLSYTIDVYKGQLKPTKNVLHFFAYLSFFPQLVAGPIVRAKEFLWQLTEYKKTNEAERWQAAQKIAFGFFKKVVIADNLAGFVDRVYLPSGEASGAVFWLATTAFAIQIYCDFSGYSDIAIGLLRLLGYSIGENFNHPYRAHSLRDFWQRWHISLSSWFRDYVYIPLGGNRRGFWFSLAAMLLTMLLSGLWHGASWNYLLWGLWHGLALAVERLLRRYAKPPAVLGYIWTMLVVLIGWAIFRANAPGQLAWLPFALGTPSFDNLKLLDFNSKVYLLAALGIGLLDWLLGSLNQQKLTCFLKVGQMLAVAAAIVACLVFRGPGSQFIYFQF